MTIQSDGNIGIGATSPASLLSVGSSSQFQVNSTGAITTATGITSSGAITFSGLSTGIIHTNASGTLSSGMVNLANEVSGLLPVANGGTGVSSFGNWQLLYTNGSGAISTLPLSSTSGQVLTSQGASSIPTWTTPTTGTLTNIATGSGLTGGPITSTGTISLANGTAAGQVYVTGASPFTPALVTMGGDATIASNGTLTIANNAVDGTDIALGSDAQGDIMYYNGTDWARLAAGTSGQVLKTQGVSANPVWATDNNSGGTVTSVGLALPSIFTVTNSPVTTTGTLTGTLASQAANTVFAAPNGSSGTPTFRTLVAADLPSHTHANLTQGTGIASFTYNGGTAATVGLANTAVTAGSYGSATQVGTFTVDAQGRLTAAANVTISGVTPSAHTHATSDITSGILPIVRGGTNSGTALNNNRIMVSSGGAIVEAAALSNGQLLIGSTGAAPVAANLNAGTGISITNSAGGITIANTVAIPTNNVTGSGANGHVSYWNGTYTQTYSSDGNFYWDETNNRLGIGITSPVAKVEIRQDMSNYGTAFTGAHLNLGANNTLDNTGFVGITYDASTSENYGWSSGALRSSNGYSDFVWKHHYNDAVGAEIMRITNTGNVGIGTVSPGQKLDVSGGSIRTTNQLISTVASGTAPLAVSSTTVNTNLNADMVDGYHYSSSWPNPSNMVTGSGTATRVAFWDGTYSLNSNANLYWDNTNSRLGIGTTSPTSQLSILTPTPTASGTAGISVDVPGTTSEIDAKGIVVNMNAHNAKASSTAIYGSGSFNGCGQIASASGSLVNMYGYCSTGYFYGTKGNVSGLTLSNFESPNISESSGSYGEISGTTTIDNTGTYWVGGALGKISGTVNGGYTGAVGGVIGLSTAVGTAGTFYGVYGAASGAATTNIGIYGTATGATTNWAGYFNGATRVTGQLSLSVANGTAPMIVTSTTVNTNLNADMLDGYHYNNLPYLTNANISGTTNYVSKFTGANAIGNSQIFDNGTNVGVGTSSPSKKLEVNGDIYNRGKLFQKTSDGQGSGAHGISWYDPAFVTWYDYMAPVGTTNSPSGTAAPTDASSGVTSWARRFNIENNAGYGWIFESGPNTAGTAPTAKFAISSNTGTFHSTGDAIIDGIVRAGANAVLGTNINGGYYQDATNGAYRSIVSSGTTNGYYFQTNAGAATTMYVGLGGTYNGNVGIGTTNPTYKLHVVGETGITSDAWIGLGSQSFELISSGWGSDRGIHIPVADDFRIYSDVGSANLFIDGQFYADEGADIVWNIGNDGSGSGSDADLLDGQHGSYYSTASHTHTLDNVCDVGNTTDQTIYSNNSSAFRVTNAAGNRSIFYDTYNYFSPVSHAGHSWFRNSTGNFTFQPFDDGDDWTRSFQLYLPDPVASGSDNLLAEIGQRMSNITVGSYKGVRIVHYTGSSTVDGYLQAGNAYFSGNVGIGTATPAARLNVSAGDASLALFGPNSSWGGKLYVGAAPNQAAALTAQVISTDGNLHIDPAPSKNMYLGYYQARDIYINPSGGNVGIGTTGPIAKLQVTGGAIMPAPGNATTAGIYFPPDPGGGGGDEAYIRYYVESGENMKLLIGTTNDADDDIQINTPASTGLTHNGYTIWDSNNDGSGSGSDADLLDGQHGSYYAAAAGNGNYIQNQYSGAQSASMWISGETRTGGWFRSSSGGTGWYSEPYGSGIYATTSGEVATYNGAYFRITGSANGSGNLRFDAANPYIYSSSYYVCPGGAYFSSGTVNTEAQYQCRGGIHNDNAGDLTIAGGSNGTTYFSGPISGMNGYYPSNNMIRLTPNLHLNSSAGNAVILNWDNGTTGTSQTLRIGNGAGSDVFDVLANGNLGIGTTTPSYKIHVYMGTSESYGIYSYRPSGNYGGGRASIYGYRYGGSSGSDGSSYSSYGTDAGVQGYTFYGNLYAFGVAGHTFGDYTRTGGTMGANSGGTTWGSLGYKNSGSAWYGCYYTSVGSGSGFMANEGILTGIGSGGYGGIMGGWSRGEVLGFTSAGELYASYNLGNEYTSGVSADIVTSNDERMPAYSVTSNEVKVYSDGKAKLIDGYCKVTFDRSFVGLVSIGKTPTVTVSALGESEGIYITSIDQDGFVVRESHGGQSNIEFTWIAVGARVDAITVSGLPEALKNKNFDNNMKGVMFNENDLDHSATPIWWDGSKIRFDAPPVSQNNEKKEGFQPKSPLPNSSEDVNNLILKNKPDEQPQKNWKPTPENPIQDKGNYFEKLPVPNIDIKEN